jgi:hypothetical protein
MSGVKGPMLSSLLSFFVVMQLYLYRISFKGFLVFGILGGLFGFLLIGSTGFRGNLSVQSLIYTLSNFATKEEYARHPPHWLAAYCQLLAPLLCLCC